MDSEFGQRLRIFRKSLNLTQSELGDLVGKTAASISDWEKNRSRPSMDDVEKMARVLGCDPGRLAFGERTQYGSSTRSVLADETLEYRGRGVEDPKSTPLIALASEFNAGRKKHPKESKIATWDSVFQHLEPWKQQAAEDPNTAPFVLKILRKHLPHADLDDSPEQK